MPRPALVSALLVSLATLLLAVLAEPAASRAPAARAGTWQRPVDGSLVRAFDVGRDPYARGRHRGVDLAARRGSPVRSACSGSVTFAGRVPRGGPTVSVRCGALVATYQQLGTIAVRAGRDVARGSPLGTVGRSGDPRQPRPHLHLGARDVTTGRYLDPLRLLGDEGPGLLPPTPAPRAAPRGAPLGPAPRIVAPRHGPDAVVPARPIPAPAWRPAPGASSPSRGFKPGVPWSAWVGLACFGLGLPIGGLVGLRRRRQSTSRVARIA